MEKLTIKSVDGLNVIGLDSEGVAVKVYKTNRIVGLQEGDKIQGYFMNDDNDPDSFYFEAVSKVQ